MQIKCMHGNPVSKSLEAVFLLFHSPLSCYCNIHFFLSYLLIFSLLPMNVFVWYCHQGDNCIARPPVRDSLNYSSIRWQLYRQLMLDFTIIYFV